MISGRIKLFSILRMSFFEKGRRNGEDLQVIDIGADTMAIRRLESGFMWVSDRKVGGSRSCDPAQSMRRPMSKGGAVAVAV